MSSSASPDVTIIGGGVIGWSVAYFLGWQYGVKCQVIERTGTASQASGWAAGELSPVNRSTPAYPPSYVSFCTEGLRLHKELYPQLREQSGIDYMLTRTPVFRPAFTEIEAVAMQMMAKEQAAYGISARWLDARELRTMRTWLPDSTLGAMYLEDEMQLETYELTTAIARAAERHGASYRQGEVTGLLREGGGIAGVVVDGEAIHTGVIVVAMGPWSKLAGEWLGYPIPVEPLRGQIVRLRLDGPLPQQAIFHSTGYVLPKLKGEIYVGTTEEYAGFDASTTPEARAVIIEAALRLAPILAKARETQMTACLRPLSLDELPIIGKASSVDEVYLATGHGRKGLLLCLATGKYLAQQIATGRSDFPLNAFAPSRFAPSQRP